MNNIQLIVNDPYLEPFEEKISQRIANFNKKNAEISGKKSLNDFSNAHLFFGLIKTAKGWIYRDRLPNATEVYLTGDFTEWKIDEKFKLNNEGNGIFLLELPQNALKHGDLYKLLVKWQGGEGERVPAYAKRVIQDDNTKIFSAQVWNPSEKYKFQHKAPEKLDSVLVYEAHIGMSSEEGKVSTFQEFRKNVLPHVVKSGYNVLQLMAIQEHPYYGSFGYHVSSFFAVSSRFGTPEDLKQLIDEAHEKGLMVIMDLVHSHAVRNENEGLSKYDGTEYQYFHEGTRGLHPAWDSRCFNYGNDEVLHFLLSNCKFWLEEYNFDGFRFDGVTSMLYLNHGLETDFVSYDQYFNDNQDEDAATYLMLANKLIHDIKPHAIVIAEEMSGMPGTATPIEEGGYGFDYRLAMGVPDFWIKLIKEFKDEQWIVGDIFYQLTNKRNDEKVISYAESHDQALVGDKTIIMRLANSDIYYHMKIDNMSIKVERAVALHKIIRLLTIVTAGDGYLNFMGNEFAHPEWIDFPREGNGWAYNYARRQWSLYKNKLLAYHFLGEFDKQMIKLTKKHEILSSKKPFAIVQHTSDQVLIFKRADLLFVFNLNPTQSFEGYGFQIDKGKYKIIFSSDNKKFLGYNRLDEKLTYETQEIDGKNYLQLYIPNRCGFVMKRLKR
ncbi:MAG: alpha amylase C-terminal domain-containing protein [Bacteroidales bacterium]|nr:alpha amylase C-terminal domain-containing protein [Bacteroidales bacterium]